MNPKWWCQRGGHAIPDDEMAWIHKTFRSVICIRCLHFNFEEVPPVSEQFEQLAAAQGMAMERLKDRIERAQQKPSIGRIVHYTNLGDADGKYPPTVQGAMITAVYDDGTVALKVFYRTGIFDCDHIPFSDEPERGHWNWPPRV